jgi:hypothetical protein
MSLLGAVITRWGSQYTMLESIKRSETALTSLAERSDIKIDAEVRATLRDDDFWIHLGKLILLLKPIDEAIRKSEAVGSDLSKVLKRWKSLQSHLVSSERFKPFEHDIRDYNTNKFDQRMEKQVSDMHWVIFYLDPTNQDLWMVPNIQRRVNNFIQQYCDIDASIAIEEFTAFRTKDGSFFEAACWDYTSDAKRFWRMQVSCIAF